jgi:hypothetical protein
VATACIGHMATQRRQVLKDAKRRGVTLKEDILCCLLAVQLQASTHGATLEQRTEGAASYHAISRLHYN